MAVHGVQLSKAGGQCRDALDDIRDRRKAVHWSNDILVQLGIVSNQANTPAIPFRHKGSRRTQFCWFLTGHYNSGGNVF